MWKWLEEHFDKTKDLPLSCFYSYINTVATPAHLNRSELITELRELYSAHQDQLQMIHTLSFTEFTDEDLLPPTLSTDEVTGNFRIIRLLGTGGSSRVYLALDTELNRHVALKVKKQRDYEASSIAQIYSDFIVEVYSEYIDRVRNLHVIVMEYVKGPSLRDVLSEIGDSSLAEIISSKAMGENLFSLDQAKEFELITKKGKYECVLSLIRSIAHGLSAIHQNGQLHLDIKPENILLTHYGRPKILDFNIATSEFSPQVRGGTINYMSPEQEKWLQDGLKDKMQMLDERADVYSLGVIVDEFCKLGFTEFSTLAKHATEKVREKRIQSIDLLITSLNHLENKLYNQKLYKQNWLTAWLDTHPKTGLFLYLFIPQMIASLFNISYNKLWVLSTFTSNELERFYNLVLYYNLTVYPLCAISAALYFRKIFQIESINVENSSKVHFFTGRCRMGTWSVYFPLLFRCTAASLHSFYIVFYGFCAHCHQLQFFIHILFFRSVSFPQDERGYKNQPFKVLSLLGTF